MSETNPEDGIEETIEEDDAALSPTRRKLLATGAASWASVALAGCGSLLGGEDETPTATEQEVANYVVTDEVIAGSEGIPEGASGFLSSGRPQRTFVPGMQAIFKVGVWDPESGDIVSDEALEEARVDLDRDTEVGLEFSRDNREWSGDWMIPDDAETGTVGYDVVVSNGAQFTDVGIGEDELEIIEYEAPSPAKYVVTTGTYTTEDTGGGYVKSCTPQYNFTPGMMVGFEIGIFDSSSGDPIGGDNVGGVTIELQNGDTVELSPPEFDEDAEHPTKLWRGTWVIPEDMEPGTVTYEVQVAESDTEVTHIGADAYHAVEQDSFQVVEATETGGEEEPNYVMVVEPYSTETTGGGFAQSCLPQHNYIPGMTVGFDVGIYDGDTSEMVGPDTIEEAAIEFQNGDSITLQWDTEAEQPLWNNTYTLPEDMETGTFTFEVVVTPADGGTFTSVTSRTQHSVGQDSIQVVEPQSYDPNA